MLNPFSYFKKTLKSFTKKDEGSILVFFALAAIPTIVFAGLTIDAGRAYYVHTVIAGAVDAAALAAGRVSDPATAKSEAKMVFNANIPPNFIGALPAGPTVTDTGTEISVTATAIVETTIMKLVGENSIDVSATALVQRENSGLELALVMDNTGSMIQDNKIGEMKAAANTLLDILYQGQNSVPGIYVALVPYTSTVNIGTYAQEPGRWNNWLTAQAQTTTNPPPLGSAPGHFYTTANGKTKIKGTWSGCVGNRLDNPVFPNGDGEGDDTLPGANGNVSKWGVFNNIVDSGCPQKMAALQSNISNIRTAISNMTPNGWTAINVGLAWGYRMLSPNWRGTWDDSSDPGTLPQDYNKTNKAIVLLTDGYNEIGGPPVGSLNDYSGYGHIYEARLGSTNYYTIQSTLNTRLTNLCTLIKSQGITIYTITLEQNNPTIQSLLRNCASNPSFYFNSPTTSQLKPIFQTIATSLQQLRLRWPGKP